MYPFYKQAILLSLPVLAQSATISLISYVVPAIAPNNAVTLDPTPVGVSFEFFAFPSYFKNVTATTQCLKNFKDLTGTWPHIRIGGTTQDRASYDANTSAYIVYSVAAAVDAPAALTFGSSFFSLAAKYAGSVVIGLNRGYNDITNTIAAAKVAVNKMGNLLAIELGNEPEYYLGALQPIAVQSGNWTPLADAKSQNNWTVLVGSAVGNKSIIQAGNSNVSPPTWGAAELIDSLSSTAKSYIYDFSHHNYPGGTLINLMSHSGIVTNMAQFTADIAAAATTGKDHVLGETNSVSGGGAAAVSPLFGAALWTMDYVLLAASRGIKRTYFHHGTVGACQYCWWGRYDMGSPYYGAYTATSAMAGGSYISVLDDGTDFFAAYVIYDADKKPLRALLYNSAYYNGTGKRPVLLFVLRGITLSTVKAKRLTAASSNSRVDQGSNPTFGGQMFGNGTCLISGVETFEIRPVAAGAISYQVFASEAVLVYLQ